ncbi:type IV pilus modification PilV family protein [Roseateles chitinivorans]|uniref:type IV pilus modification PilV family protein n=1 Tax=Roseateles chitinivorans TaxID=2917965 RepID=UPI003D669653
MTRSHPRCPPHRPSHRSSHRLPHHRPPPNDHTGRAGRRLRRGFALIEALIALVLLSIAAASLMTLQARLRIAADEARHHDQALRLARNELERWRGQPDAPSPALSWEGPDIAFAVVGGAALTADAAAPPGGSAPDAGLTPLPLRPVQLRVQWTDRAGHARSITLESLLPLTDPALSGWLLRPPGSRR